MSETTEDWRAKRAAAKKKYVQLDLVEKVYPVKNKTTGLPELVSVKPDQEKKVIAAIQGFIIGEYMNLSAFNKKMGRSGFSTPYFTKQDTITVFEGKSKVFAGKVVEAKEFMAEFFGEKSGRNIIPVSVKANKVFILGTSKGLVSLETNSSLAMRDSKKIAAYKDSYLVKFVAKVYDPTTDYEKGMGDNFREMTLPPTFALPSMGIPLTPDIEAIVPIGKFDDEFAEFEKFITTTKEAHYSPEEDDGEDPTARTTSTVSAPVAVGVPSSVEEDDSEDLPF